MRASGYELATIGRRTAALLLDGVLAVLVCAPVLYVLTGGVRSPVNRWLGLALLLVVYALWSVMLSWRGQTPAKMLLGIEVIRRDGGYLSFAEATRRQAFYVAYSIVRAIPPPDEVWGREALNLITTFILAVDLFAVFRSPARQTWHDRLAASYVVQRRQPT